MTDMAKGRLCHVPANRYFISGHGIRLSQEPAWRFLLYVVDELPVRVSQSTLWLELSLRSQLENEHQFLCTVFAICISLLHYLLEDHVLFALNLVHVFIVGIVFFIILDGDCTLRHWEHLYIYIQAWLLIQGIQFSTDH